VVASGTKRRRTPSEGFVGLWACLADRWPYTLDAQGSRGASCGLSATCRTSDRSRRDDSAGNAPHTPAARSSGCLFEPCLHRQRRRRGFCCVYPKCFGRHENRRPDCRWKERRSGDGQRNHRRLQPVGCRLVAGRFLARTATWFGAASLAGLRNIRTPPIHQCSGTLVVRSAKQ